jgi:plastocyanin
MEARARTFLAFVLAGALVLAMAACSSDDSGNGGGNGGTPAEDTGGGDTGGAGGGADLTAAGSAWDPTELEVASGDSITVQNDDGFDHTFTVEKTDIDQDLAPGSSTDVSIDLDAGDYGFMCTIHPSMTGTLTVT